MAGSLAAPGVSPHSLWAAAGAENSKPIASRTAMAAEIIVLFMFILLSFD